MKDINDIATMVIGALAAIGFFNYKTRITTDEQRFNKLANQQSETDKAIAKLEADLKGVSTYFIKTLEEIKNQNARMSSDITDIKVSLASIPKRANDSRERRDDV